MARTFSGFHGAPIKLTHAFDIGVTESTPELTLQIFGNSAHQHLAIVCSGPARLVGLNDFTSQVPIRRHHGLVDRTGTPDVAEAVSWSALERKESRGANQRLDDYGKRDDARFLKHSTARYRADAPPEIAWQGVNITRLPPAERVYFFQA